MRLSSIFVRASSALEPATYPIVARQLGWIVVPYGAQLIIRLGTNIALARLLAPEIFGFMLLVNTLRTGAELLSDIGIGQSVVRSPNGDDPRFLNTAWSLQILRGFLLTITMIIAAGPISYLYGRTEIFPILCVVSFIFIIGGASSPALFILHRKMKLKKRAVYELSTLIFQCVTTIIIAYWLRNVWALVIGLVLTVSFTSAASYIIEKDIEIKFTWEKSYVREIFNFGKWIFLSTAVYFAASSFDRAYFVAAISLSMAGVYGVSRTFSEILGQLAQRTGSLLVFPRMAALQNERAAMAPRLRARRKHALAMVAFAAGIGIAGADKFILMTYDARYHAAAFMVPFLLVTTWFGVLSTFADSMLMGCGRPAPGARANIAKFLLLLVGLPIAVSYGSMMQALLVLLFAEMARWMMLILPSKREGFMGVSDDLQLTLFMLVTALIVKWAVSWTGLIPSFEEWWALHILLKL
jgi:O-antigen/teichoic acid export membrane protein